MMRTMLFHEFKCDLKPLNDDLVDGNDSVEFTNSDDELLALIYGDEKSTIASVMLVKLVWQDGVWQKEDERKLVLPNT